MWLILLFGFFIIGTIDRLGRRIVAQKYPDNTLQMLILFYAFLLPIGWGITLVSSAQITGYPLWDYVFIGTLGVVWPLSGIFVYIGNRSIDAGLMSLLGVIAPLVTIVMALVFLGESLVPIQYIGIVLLIASSLVATTQLRIGDSTHLKKGVFFGVLAAVFTGLGSIYEKYSLSRVDLGTYIFVAWNMQAVWVVLLALILERKKTIDFFWQRSPAIRFASPYLLATAVKSPMFLGALSLVSASVLVPASRFQTVFVLFAAYVFLGEKDHLQRKILAAVIGLVGLILISINA